MSSLKNFFERNRSRLTWIIIFPVLLVLIISPISDKSFYDPYIEYLGFFFLMVASIGRIWTSLFICGRKDTELVKDGPFSICRNPLYLFSFIGGVGLMLAGQNIILAGLMIPLFWGYYHFVIKGEEKRLQELFGDDYIEYSRRTPRVIPRFSLYRSPSEVTINIRTMERSIMDASCFLLMIVLIEILEQIKMG